MLLEEAFRQSNKFTDTENSVIAFIMKNPRIVIQSTIKELSSMTHSSSTTILRICKKIDIDGFPELKIRLSMEINSFSVKNYRVDVDQPISNTTSDEDIPREFLNLHYQSLTDTYNNIDFSRVRYAARMLLAAQDIMIVGTGESLILGSDFHYKLLRINRNSILESFEGFQQSKIRRLNSKSSIALVISQYGRSTSVLRSIKALAHNGVSSILITSARNNPMIPYATMAIIIDNTETHYKMGSFASRTSILYILDCIYAIIFKDDYYTNLKTIEEARKL